MNHAPLVVLSTTTGRGAMRAIVRGGANSLYQERPMTVVGVAAHGFKASTSDFHRLLDSSANRPELNAWGTPAGDHTLYGSPNGGACA